MEGENPNETSQPSEGNSVDSIKKPEIRVGEKIRLGENEYQILSSIGPGAEAEVYAARLLSAGGDLPDVVIKLPNIETAPLSHLTRSQLEAIPLEQMLRGVDLALERSGLSRLRATLAEGEVLERLNRAEDSDWIACKGVIGRLKRAVKTVKDRTIVANLETGFKDGCPYLIQEMAPPQLKYDDFLFENLREDEERTLNLSLSLAKAIRVAHQKGIALADFSFPLKADRIRVPEGGDGSEIKIIDWNVSGNPDSFPEDLTNLGVHLFHYFTGRNLDLENLPKEFDLGLGLPEWERLSLGVKLVLRRLLNTDPSRRYQTDGELVEDLEFLKKSWQEIASEKSLNKYSLFLHEDPEKAMSFAWYVLHSKRGLSENDQRHWETTLTGAREKQEGQYWLSIGGARSSFGAGMFSKSASLFAKAEAESSHPEVIFYAGVSRLMAKTLLGYEREKKTKLAGTEPGMIRKAQRVIESFIDRRFVQAGGLLEELTGGYPELSELAEFGQLRNWAKVGEAYTQAEEAWKAATREDSPVSKLEFLLKSREDFSEFRKLGVNFPLPGIRGGFAGLDKDIESAWQGFWEEAQTFGIEVGEVEKQLGGADAQKRSELLAELESRLKEQSDGLAPLLALRLPEDESNENFLHLQREISDLETRRKEIRKALLGGGASEQEVAELRRGAEVSGGLFEMMKAQGLVERPEEMPDAVRSLLALKEVVDGLRMNAAFGRQLKEALGGETEVETLIAQLNRLKSLERQISEAGLSPGESLVEQVRSLRQEVKSEPETPKSKRELMRATLLVNVAEGLRERYPQETYPQFPNSSELEKIIRETVETFGSGGRDLVQFVGTNLEARLQLGGFFLSNFRTRVFEALREAASPDLKTKISKLEEKHKKTYEQIERLRNEVVRKEKIPLIRRALEVIRGELQDSEGALENLNDELDKLEDRVFDEVL